jgi:hypothetical protein
MLNNDFYSQERPLSEAEHIRQDERMADFLERWNRRLDWDEFPPPPAKPKGDKP